MTTTNPMTGLYSRLGAVGIDRAFVRRVALPAWWEDSIADTQAGYADALGLIAFRLNLSLEQLWDDKAALSCPNYGVTRFKKLAKVQDEELQWPKCVALAAARFAAGAADRPYTPLPASAVQIRQEILAQGHRWVALDNLLDYLWEHGLPVLHVSHFPRGKKMAGVSAMIDGRPVIVVSWNHSLRSKVLFDIAHELGHILRGHVDEHTVVVDARIAGLDRDRKNELDQDEKQADSAAVELLVGKDITFDSPRKFIKAPQLAAEAIRAAARYKVHPGVIAQNFAHGRDIHGLGVAACKFIADETDGPLELVHRKMWEHLDREALTDDGLEFLEGVTKGKGNALPVGH